MRGALALSKETETLMAGIPATIDNDVYGTDETIGFDTAVNTAVDEIDKIRDTAVSHERIFIVEVMGRQRGFLASMVGLTVGAEIILVPEVKYDEEALFSTVKQNVAMGKRSAIIVAAEGIGDTRKIAADIQQNLGLEARLSIIGYAQRGGSPTARSRYLASEFGNRAVQLISGGQGNRVVGIQNGKITDISLEESCGSKKVTGLEYIGAGKNFSDVVIACILNLRFAFILFGLFRRQCRYHDKTYIIGSALRYTVSPGGRKLYIAFLSYWNRDYYDRKSWNRKVRKPWNIKVHRPYTR